MARFQIRPLTFLLLLALAGCTTDTIKRQASSDQKSPSKTVTKSTVPDLIKLGRPNDFTTVYLATRSIQKVGQNVHVWQFAIHDYPIRLAKQGTALSSEAKVAFNCQQKSQALLQSRTFTDNAGKRPIGDPLSFPDKPSSYKPIKPGSVASRALAVVCGSS